MLTDRMRRSLAALRAAGDPVALGDLACRLFALSAPPEAPLARRLVAGLLGVAPERLQDPLAARDLRPAAERAVAELPIEDASFAVIDLETTGVCRERDAIIEIGAVRVAALRVTSQFETLLRPPGPGPLSSAIVALTGIDEAVLIDAPPAHRALSAFAAWLDAARREPWVAHNAAFDAGFLRRAYSGKRRRVGEVAVLCTQRLSRRLLPELGRYDLDHLCANFGISNRARHRALGDAEATARAWIELPILARDQGYETIGDLLDLQERKTKRKRRCRAPTGPSRPDRTAADRTAG